MNNLTIRSADAADFQPLMALYRRSILDNPRGFIQDLTFHGSLIEHIPGWRKQRGDVIVAYLENVLVGLGALAPLDAARAELCKLHVDADYQGAGVGRAICETLIATARRSGFFALELHVTLTQERAIALYQSLGFVQHQRAAFETVVFGKRAVFDTVFMRLLLSKSVRQHTHSEARADLYLNALSADLVATRSAPRQQR
jgi:ribosomal protein S18 acetylase RimI-like enzyme